MYNKKSTKKALLTSALCLILCVSMLIGTTFAWFTDSVVTTNNKIVSGNLDVALYWSTDASNWKTVDVGTNVFTNELWEPGHTEVVYLKVVNEGTLALKYNLNVNVAAETEGTNVAGESFKLSDYILYNVYEEVKTYANSAEARGDETGNKLNVPYNKATELEAGKETVLTMAVFMPTTVGNEANYLKETEAPSISLGINLFATQFTKEEDSFGPNYDGVIAWLGGVDYSWYDPDATEVTIGSAEQLAGLAAIVNGTAVNEQTRSTAAVIQDDFAGVTITLDSDINLNNIPWTPIGDVDADEYVGFKGTFNGNGHTIYNLNIETASWGQGLFGYLAEHCTVKNVNIHNANVSAEDTCGVIAGYVVKTGTFENIHVTGDITVTGNEQVGGIVGHGGYATFIDCSVLANAGSSITATKNSFVAGIVGYHREGSAIFSGCAVENLTITGYGAVGGIVGYAGYGNTISGCSVKNVVLNKTSVASNPSVGVFTGCWGYNANSAITITNNEADVVALNGSSVAYAAYDVMYGSEYNGKTSTNFVLENNALTNITNNLCEVLLATPETVQNVINDAENGAVIALAAGKYHTTIVAKSNITLVGTSGAVVDCVNLNGSENVTLKNIVFDAAGAKEAYYSATTAQVAANIFSDVTADVGARNIVIDGCVFEGEFGTTSAYFKAAIGFTGIGRSGGYDGNITIQNCTFNTVGAGYDVYGYYVGNSNMTFTIVNNTFADKCSAGPIFLNRYASSEAIIVKGNTFETVDSLVNAMYVKPHSATYTPTIDDADNIFNG